MHKSKMRNSLHDGPGMSRFNVLIEDRKLNDRRVRSHVLSLSF